jgi:Mn2+/Fe2+ NRAMP family transporter
MANDLCQTFGWRYGLHAKARDARRFYLVIAAVTALAVVLNFAGVNPFRALVWSGIVQGFSAPVLLALILWLTNRRRVLGDKVNTRRVNFVGSLALFVLCGAAVALIVRWLAG